MPKIIRLSKWFKTYESLLLISYLEPLNLYCFIWSKHLLYQAAFNNFIGFGLVKMYLQAINYQYIPSGLKVIAIFKTDYGRTDTTWDGYYLLLEKSSIWQFHWFELVNMYLHVKNYQQIPSGLKPYEPNL